MCHPHAGYWSVIEDKAEAAKRQGKYKQAAAPSGADDDAPYGGDEEQDLPAEGGGGGGRGAGQRAMLARRMSWVTSSIAVINRVGKNDPQSFVGNLGIHRKLDAIVFVLLLTSYITACSVLMCAGIRQLPAPTVTTDFEY